MTRTGNGESGAMKNRTRRIAIVVGAVVVLWLLGDFIYSVVIAARIRSWEATIERDESGVQVGCQAYELGAGDDAILFLHGINDSPACYRLMAEALAERGYVCHAMRLPGFAEETEVYASGKREEWLLALERELKVLKQNHRRVVLVAHSLGGAIAIHHLRRNPQAADGVVLLAPAVEVASDRSPLLPPETWHEIANRLLLSTKYTQSPFGLDAKVVTDADYPYRSPFSARPLFDQTFALIRENRKTGPQFTTPMMMILSPDDRVIDSQAAEIYFAQVAATKKELHHLEDTGHAMTVDHKWPKLVDFIDDFHAGLAPPDEHMGDEHNRDKDKGDEETDKGPTE